MPSPSHLCTHKAWQGCLCWSHVPWQEDCTVPSVARRLSPAPLHCLLPFIFPFNNKKEGGKKGRPDVHMTSQLLRKHVQGLFLEFIDFNKACSIFRLLWLVLFRAAAQNQFHSPLLRAGEHPAPLRRCPWGTNIPPSSGTG